MCSPLNMEKVKKKEQFPFFLISWLNEELAHKLQVCAWLQTEHDWPLTITVSWIPLEVLFRKNLD